MKPEFDQFADAYDQALEKGISLSGENKDFFAEARIAWLQRRLDARSLPGPAAILDYGCGTGSSIPYLHRWAPAARLLGVDISSASLQRARAEHPEARFDLPEHVADDERVHLVFSNGTFHHIPLDQRDGALGFIHRHLARGGLFALWENNPWNPGTRWVMSRIPFDRDAITLPPPYARALLARNGFEVLETTFAFVFPSFLKFARPIEPALSRLPLGAQYLVLARRL